MATLIDADLLTAIVTPFDENKKIDFDSLKKMGVVLKRAAYFITCNGKTMFPLKMNQDFIARSLANVDRRQTFAIEEDTTYRQMTLMDLEAKA